MVHTAQPVPIGEPMSWDEYEKLGPDLRGEYIDGNLVVSPGPSRPHQRICRRLANLLEGALPPKFEVESGWAWKPAKDEFVPDVMVYPRTEEVVRFTGVPVLAVEVLSTNRRDDLVGKTMKYAAVGLPHYWIVDPRDRTLSTYALDETGIYRRTVALYLEDAPAPTELSFGVGTVVVDLAALLGEP